MNSKRTKMDLEQDGNFNEREPITLLCLNDECLLEICSYLRFEDLIEMVMVSDRFKYICEIISRRRKILDVDELGRYRLNKLERILRYRGPHIRSIKTHTLMNLDLSLMYCTNIESVELSYVREVPPYVLSTILANEKLRILCLYRCDITDDACALLRCPELKELNLTRNKQITGTHIADLHKLENLFVSETNFTTENLVRLCKNVKALRKLDIIRCHKIHRGAFDELINHSDSLETLKIDKNQIEYVDIGKFRRLKKLTISWNCRRVLELSDNFLHSLSTLSLHHLAISYAKISEDFVSHLPFGSLQTLALEDCTEIDNRFLEMLANQAPNLKRLACTKSNNITNNAVFKFICRSKFLVEIDLAYCSKIGNTLIHKIVDELNRKARLSQLSLILTCTRVDPAIKQCSQVVALSASLHLSMYGLRLINCLE